MSRKKVAVLCLGYFAALVAYALYAQLRQPFGFSSVGNPAVIGEMIGEAVAVYLMSGVIPIIVWAFFRFRAEYFAAPLVIWVILGIVCLAAIGIDEGRGRTAAKQSDDELPETGTLTGVGRTNFALGATHACLRREGKRNIHAAGISYLQIYVYCDCTSFGMADVATAEEIRDTFAHHEQPASLQEKRERINGPCADRARKSRTSTVSAAQRADFIQKATRSCIDVGRSLLGDQAPQQDPFCDCYAEGLADVITPEELPYYAMDGKRPASLAAKLERIRGPCNSFARFN